MAQRWHDLLFAHWPLPPEQVRFLVPWQLELDTYDGRAWVGVIPFRMSGIRLRGLPSLPGLSAFPELNVRTYVRFGAKPGVFFFSLDVTNSAAVWFARTFYRLPYFRAEMSLKEGEDGWISYRSHRSRQAEFVARYRPLSEPAPAQPGGLDYFLTERYCLYTVTGGRVHRAEIRHRPWRLQRAEAEIERSTMAAAAGIELPAEQPPLVHFARELSVLIWWPQRLV